MIGAPDSDWKSLVFGRLCRTDFGQTRALQLLKSKRKEIWCVQCCKHNSRIILLDWFQHIAPVFFLALSGSETDPDDRSCYERWKRWNISVCKRTSIQFWCSQNSQCTSKNHCVILLSKIENLVVIHDTHNRQEEFRALGWGKHHVYGSSFPNLSSNC